MIDDGRLWVLKQLKNAVFIVFCLKKNTKVYQILELKWFL